jgi:hypothetical protein
VVTTGAGGLLSSSSISLRIIAVVIPGEEQKYWDQPSYHSD